MWNDADRMIKMNRLLGWHSCTGVAGKLLCCITLSQPVCDIIHGRFRNVTTAIQRFTRWVHSRVWSRQISRGILYTINHVEKCTRSFPRELRQQRKSDAMTYFGLSARSGVYWDHRWSQILVKIFTRHCEGFASTRLKVVIVIWSMYSTALAYLADCVQSWAGSVSSVAPLLKIGKTLFT
jgi:hypothetical protein